MVYFPPALREKATDVPELFSSSSPTTVLSSLMPLTIAKEYPAGAVKVVNVQLAWLAACAKTPNNRAKTTAKAFWGRRMKSSCLVILPAYSADADASLSLAQTNIRAPL